MVKYCRVGDHGPIPGIKLVNGVCEECLRKLQDCDEEALARATLARRAANAEMMQHQLTVFAGWAFNKEHDVTVAELRRWVRARDKADDEVEEAQLRLNVLVAKRKNREHIPIAQEG